MADEIVPLPLDSARWDGISFGDSQADAHLEDDGLTGLGQPPRKTILSDLAGDGQAPGSSTSQARSITASVWVDKDKGTGLLWRIISSMDARPTPADHLPLTFRLDLLWPDTEVRVYARPQRCDPVIDEDAVKAGATALDLEWWAADPTIYSEDLHEDLHGTAGVAQTHTVTQAGTRAAVTARGLRFRLQASTTVVSPFWQRGTHKVSFPGLALTAGQTLELHEDGHYRVGSQGVDGYARTGNSDFEDTPFLLAKPAVNSVLFGATSGTFTTRLLYRDTW